MGYGGLLGRLFSGGWDNRLGHWSAFRRPVFSRIWGSFIGFLVWLSPYPMAVGGEECRCPVLGKLFLSRCLFYPRFSRWLGYSEDLMGDGKSIGFLTFPWFISLG